MSLARLLCGPSGCVDGQLANDVELGRVLAVPIQRPSISWSVSLCHAVDRPPSRAMQTVAAVIESEARNLVRQGRWPARLATSDISNPA